MSKFDNAIKKLEKEMLAARKNYVKTMFYVDDRVEIKDISYIRIPCTESYTDTYYGLIKTDKYGAFVNGKYVETEYGYINKEISCVDDEYVKNSEIKFEY